MQIAKCFHLLKGEIEYLFVFNGYNRMRIDKVNYGNVPSRTIVRETITIRVIRPYLLTCTNRALFSTNNKKHSPQQDDENKGKQNTSLLTEKQMNKMVFEPIILLSTLKSIIQFQVKNIESIKLQKHLSTEAQNDHYIRLSLLLRQFMLEMLRLNKRIAVMNEIVNDEDYKLDVVFKVLQRLKQLHVMLQQQINANQNIGGVQTSLLIWCQILTLIKTLQLSPNDKSFNPMKCIYYFKTWKDRWQYFIQTLPLGVHNRFFRQANSMTNDILKNLVDIESRNQENESNNLIIWELIETLFELTKSEYLNVNQQILLTQSQLSQLTRYITKYKELTHQHYQEQDKINSSLYEKHINTPQQYNKWQSSTSNDSRQKEYIIQKPDRKLEMHYGFVERCVLMLLVRSMNKEEKVDGLNDMRGVIMRQYQRSEWDLENIKEQQQHRQQLGTSMSPSQQFKIQQLLQQHKTFIVKCFIEYLRHNIVVTWTIYKAEDLLNHQLYKKSNANLIRKWYDYFP